MWQAKQVLARGKSGENEKDVQAHGHIWRPQETRTQVCRGALDHMTWSALGISEAQFNFFPPTEMVKKWKITQIGGFLKGE